MSSEFFVNNDVKQVAVLSPMLFTIYIWKICYRIEEMVDWDIKPLKNLCILCYKCK